MFIFIFIIICMVKTNHPMTEYEYFKNGDAFSYYRCKNKELGKITKDIFDKYSISNSNKDWNIYVPCGYNNVEEELKKILIVDDPNDKYIFGLNGCDSIVSKNKIWESLVECYGRKKASTLMPESYVLDNPNDMTSFRQNFNPTLNEIYILKKNVQRKEGLKLTRSYFDITEAVGSDYRVVQKYMTDLYLINQRKVNLRVYLLVVIKDGVVKFFLCRNGKCIYTKNKYNDDDLDFESNITSYHLDMSIYKENPRSFQQLKEFLGSPSGNILFDNIHKLMKEISVCLSKNFYQSQNIKGSTTFQLFGADVIFDSKLHPYLLEINKGPDMSARDNEDEMMKLKVQKDMFKIIGIISEDDGQENSFYQVY